MTRNSWPFPTSKPDDNGTRLNLDSLTVTIKTATQEANDLGVRFAHLFVAGKKGGCTVAYAPTSDYRGSKMLDIAVAYTHPNDQYTRKVGAELAAERWLAGQAIQMPLRGRDNHQTQYNLWRAFYEPVYNTRNDEWF